MSYKINNIHAVDTLIRKIRFTQVPARLKKLSDRGKSRRTGVAKIKTQHESHNKKESFQQALKKAMMNRRKSWRA